MLKIQLYPQSFICSVSFLQNLQPKELNEKVEIKEVEIPNKSVNELTATHSLEKKTGQLEDEELSVVSEEPQDQVKEEEKSVKVDAIRDDGTPKIEVNTIYF